MFVLTLIILHSLCNADFDWTSSQYLPQLTNLLPLKISNLQDNPTVYVSAYEIQPC